MVPEMYLMCAALEKNFCEVLAQLVVMVKCSANSSLLNTIEQTQEVLGSIAAPPRPTMLEFFQQTTSDSQFDLAKLKIKLVDQVTEQARVELEHLALDFLDDDLNTPRQRSSSSLSNGGIKRTPTKEELAEKDERLREQLAKTADRKTEPYRFALDRCVELAICDMSAHNKGELPLCCRTLYGRQSLKDDGSPHTRLLSSESFLRALRYVVEEGKSGFEFLSIEKSKSMYYVARRQVDFHQSPNCQALWQVDSPDSDDDVGFGHGSSTSSSTSWALRGLVLDCIRPSSDGTMFGYSPSSLMLQTFSKGWKQGPRAGIFVAQPSLLLELEPCLILIILDNLHDSVYARMASVCKCLQTMAKAQPDFQVKMALGKDIVRQRKEAGTWLSSEEASRTSFSDDEIMVYGDEDMGYGSDWRGYAKHY